MRGGRGEVLCKSEKKKWRVRLGEEKNKGKLDEDSGFRIRFLKMGGTQTLTMKTGLWRRTEVTTGVRRPVLKMTCLALNPAPLLKSSVALSKFPNLPDPPSTSEREG